MTMERVVSDGAPSSSTGAIFVATTKVDVANTVTNTSLVGAGVGSLVIPPATVAAGALFRFTLRGYMRSTGSPTASWSVLLGGTLLMSANYTAAVGVNKGWSLDGDFAFYSVGGAATVWCQSYLNLSNVTYDTNNITSATVDTTVSNTIDFKVQWSAADALNAVHCTNLYVEQVA